MAKKDKKDKDKFEGMKRRDFINFLRDSKYLLGKARHQKDIEQVKVNLIKSYNAIKQDKSLADLNEPRINLLKNCNINLQFLHRVQDARRKLALLDIQGAYEDTLNASRAMYSHPDRALLHDWIREEIRQSLEFVAKKAADEEKRQKAKDVKKTVSPDQTFIPGSGVQPVKSEESTSKDPLQTLKPEPSSDPFISPFSTQSKSPQDSNQTIFPSQSPSLNEDNTFRPGFSGENGNSGENKTVRPMESKNLPPFPSTETSPFSNTDQTIKSPFDNPDIKEDPEIVGENSIKTFWKRKETKNEQ